MDKKDKPLWGKKSWLVAFGFIVLASFWLFNIDENTPLKIKKKNNKLPTEEIGALPPGNSKTDEKSSFQAKVDEVERIKKMALKLRPCELEKMILGKKSHGAQAEHVFKALKGEKNAGTYEVFYQAIFTSDPIGLYEWEDFIYDLEYGARFLAATAHFKEFSGRAKGSLTSNKLFKKLVRHYKREEDIGYLLLVMKKEAESRNRLKVIRSLLKLVDNKKVFEGYQAKVFNDLAGLAETPQELILAYFLRSAAPRVNFNFLVKLKKNFEREGDYESSQRIALIGKIMMDRYKNVKEFADFDFSYYALGSGLAKGDIDLADYPHYRHFAEKFHRQDPLALYGSGCDDRRWIELCEKECSKL